MEIKTKAKHVTDWWVEQLPNGIFHLLINTDERWINFHAYNDEMYIIGDKEGDSPEVSIEKTLILPKFLPEIKKGLYLCTVMQNKDQISFYYIPYYYEWVNQKNIIISSKNF